MRAALLSLNKRLGLTDFFAAYVNGPATLLVLPQLVALGLMAATENDGISIAAFLLSWGFLNFVLLAFIRRPAVAGFVSLILITVLVLLSSSNTTDVDDGNFVDVMIVDTDTIAFLFTIFPGSALVGGVGRDPARPDHRPRMAV